MKMTRTTYCKYVEKDGTKGEHKQVHLVEFTGATDSEGGFHLYTNLKLLSEEGRPSFADGDGVGLGGGVAPHFMNRLHMIGFGPAA